MGQRQQALSPNSTASTIGFKTIHLFKGETLGIGSYGKVCRAKCDHLLCAAKIIHRTLLDPMAAQQMSRESEHRLPIRRFEQECELLNTIRHPNVIQYLGMYRDPDTGLPVLLMELMDESLTHFLETATKSIPYHIQINICHDVALALAFLHANNIIHRDLSSNNVLLIGNVRAKVTDFGMAKYGQQSLTSQLSLTMCPGADVYMPPEATKDQPIYTEKIDCFSFGVIIVQILTCQFPNPSDRQKSVVAITNYSGLPSNMYQYIQIPEVERRQNHIKLINPDHTLLPIALSCLQDKDVERPFAQQLCQRISILKECRKYSDSITAAMVDTQMQVLKKEHARATQLLEEEYSGQIQNLRHVIQVQTTYLVEKDETLVKERYDAQNQLQLQCKIIEDREREIHRLKERLEESRHQFMISDRKPIQIRNADALIRDESDGMKQIKCRHQKHTRDHELNIKLSWRKGKPAPQIMNRWCNAVTDESMIYINTDGNRTILCCDTSEEHWIQLPDCPNECSSFAVINGLLTAIGGIGHDGYSNSIHCLTGDSEEWIEEFPPMPTKRHSTTAICTETELLVIGGVLEERSFPKCPVEVMHLDSCQWSTAADVPIKDLRCASGVVCNDRLYVLGAIDTQSVHSCLLSNLLQSCQSEVVQSSGSNTYNVWDKLTDLPVEDSTCVSLRGHLLAIGGSTYNGLINKPTRAVYIYKPITATWEIASQMLMERYLCFAVTLSEDKVMVIGGSSVYNVEFANLEVD